MGSDKKTDAGASSKKLQLSKETVRALSVKSGMKTGRVGIGPHSTCPKLGCSIF